MSVILSAKSSMKLAQQKKKSWLSKLILAKTRKFRKAGAFYATDAQTHTNSLPKTTERGKKMSSSERTCREQGFRMPAEWEKHDAIWLAWPYDPTTFPDRVECVESTYVQIVKEIHEGEEVNLFVRDEPTKQKATEMFKAANIDLDRIHFYVSDYADVWFRDYGPVFVKNQNTSLR